MLCIYHVYVNIRSKCNKLWTSPVNPLARRAHIEDNAMEYIFMFGCHRHGPVKHTEYRMPKNFDVLYPLPWFE